MVSEIEKAELLLAARAVLTPTGIALLRAVLLDHDRLREALEIASNTAGDLRNGFAKLVDPARWVEQFQAHCRAALAASAPPPSTSERLKLDGCPQCRNTVVVGQPCNNCGYVVSAPPPSEEQ